jgi:hypothetical protein
MVKYIYAFSVLQNIIIPVDLRCNSSNPFQEEKNVVWEGGGGG